MTLWWHSGVLIWVFECNVVLCTCSSTCLYSSTYIIPCHDVLYVAPHVSVMVGCYNIFSVSCTYIRRPDGYIYTRSVYIYIRLLSYVCIDILGVYIYSIGTYISICIDISGRYIYIPGRYIYILGGYIRSFIPGRLYPVAHTSLLGQLIYPVAFLDISGYIYIFNGPVTYTRSLFARPLKSGRLLYLCPCIYPVTFARLLYLLGIRLFCVNHIGPTTFIPYYFLWSRSVCLMLNRSFFCSKVYEMPLIYGYLYVIKSPQFIYKRFWNFFLHIN